MQARRAARELSLILFSQLDDDIIKFTEDKLDDILVNSVRTLTNNAQNDLKNTSAAIFEIKEFIETYELEHPINIKRPIEANNIEVPLPMTVDMIDKLEDLLNISENAMLALEIAEMTVLEEKEDVKKFVLSLISSYQKNHKEIDDKIKTYAHGWDLSRLVKMDKDILRIALTELLFIKDAPFKVIVDEALELAKKYSTEDSSSFINGILSSVISESKLS